MKRKLFYLFAIVTAAAIILLFLPLKLYADPVIYKDPVYPIEMKITPGYYNELNTVTLKYSGNMPIGQEIYYFIFIDSPDLLIPIWEGTNYRGGDLLTFPFEITAEKVIPYTANLFFSVQLFHNWGDLKDDWYHFLPFQLTYRPPARPLTPEEWVLTDLNINQLLDLYGATPEGFVKMLYDNILGRVPDDKGLSDWVAALNNGMAASEAAYYMVFSDELNLKISSMSSEEFISFLYDHVLDRNQDVQGYDQWLAFMASGNSRPDTLRAFLNNEEWANICGMFNVAP